MKRPFAPPRPAAAQDAAPRRDPTTTPTPPHPTSAQDTTPQTTTTPCPTTARDAAPRRARAGRRGRAGRSRRVAVRRLLLAAVVVVAAVATAAPTASAHPLGNFSTNHLVRVRISPDRVDLRYVLDQAEIPTFQQRGLDEDALRARTVAEVRRGLTVRVNGRSVAWRMVGTPRLAHPPGQGGLPLTRLELTARVAADGARAVTVRDATFPGRVGWKTIVVVPGRGTAVRSSVPATDPTDGLRRYPRDLLASPADTRSATFSVSSGTGTVTAPDADATTGATTTNRPGDGFTGVFERVLTGHGAFVVLLLAAFAWGAIHALSPGHGKAMVAAYLVGTRGTARHAALLGLTVTVTHTAGVFALGVVTLAASAYVLPERLYPWLNLASGLLVLGVGAAVLRSRVRWARARRRRQAGARAKPEHPHGHRHHHAHAHDHAHSHATGHAGREARPDRPTTRSLVALGASAGLLPCPSALVVLLAAIAQHQIALGLLLIVVFSTGLAATLTALGLLVVGMRSIGSRLPVPAGAVAALPALSTLLIVGLGVALTIRALPAVL